jgi:hypothetical protein
LRWALAVLVVGWAAGQARGAPVELVEEAPARVVAIGPNSIQLDFGRVAFGNLLIAPPAGCSGPLTVRFGEACVGGRIDRAPRGSVRYAEVKVDSVGGTAQVVAPAANVRNTTQPQAVLTPGKWGVVLPFRWVEIDGWRGGRPGAAIRRRAAYSSSWSDGAAAFRSSDDMLNRIWDLCHYSIKATSFAGVFVDGDRERTAYEADAYLNQLGYFAGDPDPSIPRATFERLLRLPTWPTEWAPHLVFIAHDDWMQTGDSAWLAVHYKFLWSKLLIERAGPDGLITSTPQQIARGDLVDWPAEERDGFVFCRVNTVVNAFYLRALEQMADLARALGRSADARELESRREAALAAFQRRLFDPVKGLYRDGDGTDHVSLHANLFPLAFGLVAEERRPRIARWLAERGMACSVYGAQYLLEALFENDESAAAVALMTAPGDRSWRHMVESGTTITWEAWDQRYKPNQDWTHAWGAAPANLLPRFVLGVMPRTPGWSSVEIRPEFGGLTMCSGIVPTPRGPIRIRWQRAERLRLELQLPEGVAAHIVLPANQVSGAVRVDGRVADVVKSGNARALVQPVMGHCVVEVP